MEKAFSMVRDVKSSVISTVKNGKPTARIIDIMHYDASGIYFVTCVTKPFYQQLLESKNVAITVMTKDYVQVRIEGEVEVLSETLMAMIFEKNPELKDLFPEDRHNFVPFRVFRGKGEIFDLSGREVKMQRERFAFGGVSVNEAGCKVRENCIACGKCIQACPFSAISDKNGVSIDPKYCDECGICVEVCPVDAIRYPLGM